jgi:hypothetical protein
MSNKWKVDNDFYESLCIWLEWKERQTGKTREQIISDLRSTILTQLSLDKELEDKIEGMAMRNNIHRGTKIVEDVKQEVFYQICKYNVYSLIEAYCDSYRRVFALCITIATRVGFGKMSKDIHQNASVAKQILYKSNLNSDTYLSSGEDEIISTRQDGIKIKIDLQIDDDKLWDYIYENLTEDEKDFLNFLFEKVLNKKYTQSYSKQLRKSYYSFNEYKILRLSLQDKIKTLIKNRKKYD